MSGPLSLWKQRAISGVLRHARAGGPLPSSSLYLIYNLAGVKRNMQAVCDAFPAYPWSLHTVAAKACGHEGLLKQAANLGLGCETASLGELKVALSHFAPDRIVFDSPVKTWDELQLALESGVHINCDNFDELDRVASLYDRFRDSAGNIGMRINPEQGGGAIADLSTGTLRSKFGVGLQTHGDQLLDAYRDHPFLRMAHVHVGSQGMHTSQMYGGIKQVIAFADQVNRQVGEQQITTLDIGGGLSVDFSHEVDNATVGSKFHPQHEYESVFPQHPETRYECASFREFADGLREAAPALFPEEETGDVAVPFRYKTITEFGRKYYAKQGFLLSEIEYVKKTGHRMVDDDVEQEEDPHLYVLSQHAGADILVRTVYHPTTWPLRCHVIRQPDNRHGGSWVYGETSTDGEQPGVWVDVAGACCIAGCVAAHGRKLSADVLGPALSQKQSQYPDKLFAALHDTGCYFHSQWSYYNLRTPPVLLGYVEPGEDGEELCAPYSGLPSAALDNPTHSVLIPHSGAQEPLDIDGQGTLQVIQRPITPEEVVSFFEIDPYSK